MFRTPHHCWEASGPGFGLLSLHLCNWCLESLYHLPGPGSVIVLFVLFHGHNLWCSEILGLGLNQDPSGTCALFFEGKQNRTDAPHRDTDREVQNVCSKCQTGLNLRILGPALSWWVRFAQTSVGRKGN